MSETAGNLDRKDEWENRVLCPDGNCIGVIGPDGRCKECGKIYEGPGSQNLPALAEEPVPAEPDESVPETEAATESEESDPDWENRVLCPDESCIGVIGPDGRCMECGKTLDRSREELP